MGSAKKCGTPFEHEVWGGQLDGKRGKLGFGGGRRVSLMLATVTGAARGLPGHDLRRLLGLWVYALSFRLETLSILDVFRQDVVVPSKVPLSTNCLCLLSVPLSWTLTFGPNHTFTSMRQTPVLQAPVLARHLCLWSFGPFFTTLRRRKLVR